MKPYLVDVPVKIDIWIRPDLQRKQFEVIKEARPSTLFLISDGGRNEKEWQAIRENRQMFDTEIDWECKIFRLYMDENHGLYAMGNEKRHLIWNNVDRCIFLEDDYVPSLSYFKFCAELLEKYKDDERILAICGMNHEGVSANVSSDYFFSQGGSIWGMATWKRIADKREWYFEHPLDKYNISLLKDNTRNSRYFLKQFKGYSKNENYSGHPRGGEYWYAFEMFTQNKLIIIPKYNMISNLGCTENAAHSHSIKMLPHGIRKIFNMKTYELSFPLKHPDYVMSDIRYKKAVDKIMGLPWYINAFRIVEMTFLTLRYKGLGAVFKRAKKVYLKKRTKLVEK